MGGRVGGRVGGWSEDWRVMLNSTQDQIKLKFKFELSLAMITTDIQHFTWHRTSLGFTILGLVRFSWRYGCIKFQTT